MFKKLKRYWYNLTHPVIGEVWQLHRVTPNRSQDGRYAPYDISPERLESLIIEYKKRGYTFVSMDEMRNRLLNIRTWGRAVCATKYVAITLDDGYQDNYENAYSIFKKYNIPFCIYVTTGYIDGTFNAREDEPPSLTKEQIKELAADSLCTLGAHTVTHPNMKLLSIEEQKKEIADSIRTMEYIIEHKIVHFAIPYGAKNEETMALLKEEGIIAQVDAWGGPIRMGMNVFCIPRYIVEENLIVM